MLVAGCVRCVFWAWRAESIALEPDRERFCGSSWGLWGGACVGKRLGLGDLRDWCPGCLPLG